MTSDKVHKNSDVKDRILDAALDDIAFDGLTWGVIEDAAEKAGFDREMAFAVFPDRLEDFVIHFSHWTDRQMMKKLNAQDFSGARMRDKIQAGVLARLEVLQPHKESVRQMASFWLKPFQQGQASKLVWKTSDVLWIWAGDTSDDYNHYTKRTLLSGVIVTTMIRWLNDNSEEMQETKEFLERRIDNVIKIGGKAGKLLKPLAGLFEKLPFPSRKSE